MKNCSKNILESLLDEYEIPEKFQDKISQTLYIGIKKRYLTEPNFNEQFLIASEEIKKSGIPDSPAELYNFLEKYFGKGFSIKFAEELLPQLSV